MLPNDGLPNGDWKEHRRLVMYRFEMLDTQVLALRAEIAELWAEIAQLRRELVEVKLKVAAIGGASGLLGWLVPQVVAWMMAGG